LGPQSAFAQKFEEVASEVHRVFCFFLSPVQRGLRDTYSAPISTVFETTDVNRCAGPYTREKFPNFCIGVLQAPKNCPGRGILGGCLLSAYSSSSTISGDRNHFGGCRQFPRMCLLYVSFDGGCTQWCSNGVGRAVKVQGPPSAGAPSSRPKIKIII